MADRVTNSLSHYRNQQNLTQEEVAQAVGVSRQTIIAIEKCNYTPSVALALKLAAFFKQSVEDIFGLTS